MTHSTTEVITGGVVLAVAAGFAFFAAQAAGLSRGGDSYLLTASFRSLEGVNVGTDVRLAGVKVGTVTKVELNTETFRADTTFTVDQEIMIPDDSAIVIASEGLLGGNFVEVMPGGSPFNFEAGDEITDTQGAVSLISLLVKFVSGSGGDDS
ncbi:outer membrane lipid asymmetry maintenance protein MlaD [Tritonibacter horizontis]|uniref:Putative phospholipid ABC transporter-binding protein MlaD n=1 Tax=Tritonibacter horizontis TaxID=1768241 RepID=A0A132BW88_9RHOB|nr:outer membrane lipid asymmetry maintenance protein MlaD [Tritonibacter horizontis]KUP92322.1 putative phospholipid ABC transporter-binding protein MlaD [Tritonibacter horizontis]